ncbi:DUF6510 family protein [Micromonospora sp. NPDC050187]|uniref:DUF6510 family protein n=1 Tax=Micromonospora sp. NPDC050187 TaxID=3364277 RepID=UPI00379829A9
MTDMSYQDGNVLDGPLRELFAVDLSGATGRCASCGRTGPMAGLHVFSHAPGLVARCPACEAVMLRLVRSPDRAWLDLRGASFVEVPMPAEPYPRPR